MGNKVTVFTEDQLEEYQACTFLTRKDILRAFRMFRNLTHVPTTMSRDDATYIKAEFSSLDAMQELKENPFRRRVCEVFSLDGSASLSFDQFLEMFSVFSEGTPREIKASYAFKVYDFDDDGFLGHEDLTQAVEHLSHDLLHPEEVKQIVEKVLEETDIDCDGRLSESEFTHAILKSPEFISNFHMRL